MTARRLRLPKTREESIDTLERFVVRARRIEAHSLVKSRKVNEYVQPNFSLHFDGPAVSMRLNSLPEDEEVFESLAARIRPCIVDSEPIQLEKVVAAVRVLTTGAGLAESQSKLLDEIDAWCKSHIAPHSYAPISSSEEIGRIDSGETIRVSDTLLGLGWYYADLVHADPRREKEAVLEFSYDARYNQGVLLVSYLALIICALLKLIRDADSIHDFGLSPEVWDSQVTAGGGPCELGVGEVYVGPAGFEPPIGVPMEQVPEFKKLDGIMATRIQCPSCAVDAQLVDEAGKALETYQGFYAIDRDRNRVVININDVILLSGKPESNTTPVEELPFEQVFFSNTAEPVNNKTDQFLEFLTKAKAASRINITTTWRGVSVGGSIAFTKDSFASNEQMPVVEE